MLGHTGADGPCGPEMGIAGVGCEIWGAAGRAAAVRLGSRPPKYAGKRKRKKIT